MPILRSAYSNSSGSDRDIDAIEIDDGTDVASLRLANSPAVFENAVVLAFQEASAGSGHEYRVKPGSWDVVRS